MIIEKSLLGELLGIGLSSGADFAEVFAENTLQSQMSLISGAVEEISDRRIYGMGFRLLKGTKSVFASTSDMSRAGLVRCARRAAEAMGEIGEAQTVRLAERIFPDIHPVRIVPSSVGREDQASLLHRACDSAKAYSGEIAQVQARLLAVDRNILVANSEGLLTGDRQVRTRLAVNAVASGGAENQSGSSSPGARKGLELYEETTPEETGREAARQAVTMLHAGYAPAGNMPVVIANGFGGVIFHEACGHSLEATSVATGRSQFCGKLGEMVASPAVTAVDDGTEPNSWGSNNIDDEAKQIISEMIQSCIDWENEHEFELSAAMAAPQLGYNRRIIVVREDMSNKDNANFIALINPEVIKTEGKTLYDYEGCLSVPTIYGKVPRPAKARIKAVLEDGTEVRLKAQDFLARTLLHEIDHLNGILFIDHIKDQTDAFYKLDDKGDLVPLDYDKYIKDNKDLWPDDED